MLALAMLRCSTTVFLTAFYAGFLIHLFCRWLFCSNVLISSQLTGMTTASSVCLFSSVPFSIYGSSFGKKFIGLKQVAQKVVKYARGEW